MVPRALLWTNLALLVLFPLAWAAPLMRAGLLPLFRLSEVSVFSGIGALWKDETPLAILVVLLALVAPYAKTLVLAAIHLGRASPRLLGLLELLGKLAMADVFLIAIYVVVAKGLRVGRIETAWGLWFFTACILASLAVASLTARALRNDVR